MIMNMDLGIAYFMRLKSDCANWSYGAVEPVVESMVESCRAG